MPSDPTNPFAPDNRPWWQSLATSPTFPPNVRFGGPFGGAFGAAPSNNWPSSPGLSSLMPSQMTLGLNTLLGGAFGGASGAASNNWPSPSGLSPLLPGQMAVGLDAAPSGTLGIAPVGAPNNNYWPSTIGWSPRMPGQVASSASNAPPYSGLFGGTLPPHAGSPAPPSASTSALPRGGSFAGLVSPPTAGPLTTARLFGASSSAPADNSVSRSLLGGPGNPPMSFGATNMGSYRGSSINPFAGNIPSLPAFPTGTSANVPQNLLLAAAAPYLAGPVAFPDFHPSSLLEGNGSQTKLQSRPSASLFDWRAPPGLAGDPAPNPPALFDPLGWARIILAAGGDRERIDPEEIFDPIAPLRVDMYNAARAALRQIQPNNYALSVSSLRALGSAPTWDEVGQLNFARRVAESTQPLAEMASRIAGLVEPFAQNFRTVSVLRTSKGTYVAGSGYQDLEPDQWDAINASGATRVPKTGTHAEIAALDYARSRGEFPQFISSSRPFCTDCKREIQNRGGHLTSPTTAVFPGNTPSVAFPSR